jgi:hypothetical protein
VRGEQYFVEGKVVPPAPSNLSNAKIDRSYRTKASGISIDCNIYADTDENVARAMARLLKCRGTYEEELEYIVNQKNFVRSHQGLFAGLQHMYTPHFSEWLGAEEECHLHYDDPHPKRDLRIAAYTELMEGNGRKFHDPNLFSRLWLRRVTYKMKKDEIAKPGKVPRMIGDLGVAASLQGFRITEVMKSAMAHEDIQYGNLRAHFCKAPTTTELTAVFKNLISPPPGCKYYFAYFSDDSCLSIRQDDGTVKFHNLDISGCDASHTEAIFRALVQITPVVAQEDMQVLVDQCKLPIELRFKNVDTTTTSRELASLILQPCDPLTGKKSPRLYSGSTITTIINNLACIMGAVQVQEDDAQTAVELMAAFKKAGYKMTIEECTDYSDLQFLKNSPAYDTTGKLQPLLNLGVLLRSAGTCKGDLPGTKHQSFKERHDAFMTSLIRGMYPRISFPLVNNMLTGQPATAASDREATRVLQSKHVHDGTAEFTQREVYRRYRLTDLQMDELDLDFAPSGYAHYYASTGASTILERDYGLLCTTDWHIGKPQRQW